MFASRSNASIVAGLLLSVFLWGGNNVGVKYLINGWPPVWVGCLRFAFAGAALSAFLAWHRRGAGPRELSPEIRRALWWRGGLSLAAYIVAYNWALVHTTASHVALYLGAAPVWALLWEGWPGWNAQAVRRYSAAALAVTGVIVLFGPRIREHEGHLLGECLGLSTGLLWTVYSRQCRRLSGLMSGAEITARTVSRAAVLLAPFALIEITRQGIVWRTDYALVFAYTVLGGAVIPFVLWNNALRHWPTSQVFLFNNLIPLSTMAWAFVCLGEAATSTFWIAMLLIVTGVLVGHANWQRLLAPRAAHPESF